MEMHILISAVLDSLDSQIAVIDRAGAILYVNQAWREFGRENGLPLDHPWIGASYLEVCVSAATCGDQDGAQVHAGIRAVLDDRSASYLHEYPCHSPNEQRWFMMRIAPLNEMNNYFVISHHIITERKLAEKRIEQQNNILAQMATTDKLTLLCNRAKLDDVLDSEIYRSRRYRSDLSIILVDIDHFKDVNDTFGHQTGDLVITSIADIMRANLRESDVAGRWGGEEFLVILPGCDAMAARRMAEKLRAAIAAHEFAVAGTRTCSFGVASCAPDHVADTLIACADAALYRAKHNGRNRVEVGTPAP